MKTKIISILIVLFILLTQVAAASGVKLVRLTVNNQSGDVVYIKLEATVGDAFYYLTIPNGAAPTYTVETDLYKRTTWACGYTTSGRLAATSNIRLKFIACDRMPNKMVKDPVNLSGCRYVNDLDLYSCPNYGEPTQEKVQYFTANVGLPILTGGCAGWVVHITFRSPAKGLCYFRYRY